MIKDKIPVNEIELENWMKENCYNFLNYSISGSAIYEGFGIDKSGSLFTWYYTEKGEKNYIDYFRSKAEIIAYAFNHIKSDKWAQTHCIGFTTSLVEKQDLNNILTNAGVDFFQDEIPYYEFSRPGYRTFVLGCAINQTSHLKDKYYSKP